MARRSCWSNGRPRLPPGRPIGSARGKRRCKSTIASRRWPDPLDKPHSSRQVAIMRGQLSKVAILALGIAAGSAMSFFTLPLWISPLIDFAQKEAQSNWLGFVGTLGAAFVAATATIVSIAVSAYIIRQRKIVSRDCCPAFGKLPILRAASFSIVCIKGLLAFWKPSDMTASAWPDRPIRGMFKLRCQTPMEPPDDPLSRRFSIASTGVGTQKMQHKRLDCGPQRPQIGTNRSHRHLKKG